MKEEIKNTPEQSEFEKFAQMVLNGFSEQHEYMDARFRDIDSRFNEQCEYMDARFDRIENRLELVEGEISGMRSELKYIHRKLDLLEERGASNAGFAKEIDELRERVAWLEKAIPQERAGV